MNYKFHGQSLKLKTHAWRKSKPEDWASGIRKKYYEYCIICNNCGMVAEICSSVGDYYLDDINWQYLTCDEYIIKNILE